MINYWPNVVRAQDPFARWRGIEQEMNRLLSAGLREWKELAFPQVNLWANGDEAVLTAELPGVDPGKVDISVMGDELTLQGEREAAKPEEGTVCHRCERKAGKFSRSLELPFEVDGDKVSARYEQGVLTVHLPRLEHTKPKRIQIKAS